MTERRTVEPDLSFIQDIKSAGGETLKKCYQCATCATVCNLSPDDRPFPRREMILAGWGQSQDLIRDPNVWLCHQCNDCSTYCPRTARPGDVLAAVRTYVYKHFAFPSFMGSALSSPAALPLLLLIPAVVLAACILLFAPRLENGGFQFLAGGTIDFNLFLPHSSVDALFVFGNIIIFIFAAIGFSRFWKGLGQSGEGRQISFLKALVLTAKEIFAHSKFKDCDANRPRVIGHLFLFYGFAGAMVTTGAVFVFAFIPHYLQLLGLDSLHPYLSLPIDLPHPVKFLGGLSGLALVIGGALLVFRRWADRDAVGANGYADYLFLYIISLTGLTGMLSWLFRWGDMATAAYVSYFLHLLCVFFLLWYMPYSKFAHMIYRTLALVHLRTVGRIKD
ncbi:MAG: quinone-interacting membrane-bound oxidoreductase complex subunit QmoC [Candidatus Zixiibacteriota bacterium]|nr:MAG: quinone-interacting membrane-bound oxidoreductase complex subunit QmoC [candidate division Zixibacteria bacterium]